MTLELTVAIPTAARREPLRRLLLALPLALQGIPVTEVLVVDNAPQHPADVGAAAVRVVVEPVPGAAAARNRALREASTPWIAFLDDDVVPEPGWLAALVAPVLADAEVRAVGGRVVLDPSVPRPLWFDEAGIGGYVTAFDLGRPAGPVREGEYVVTANALFHVPTLLAVGGFDEALGPRPGAQIVADDVHVVRELQRAGHEVRWQPDAVVVHDFPEDRRRPRWLLRRAYLQGRSDWLLDADLFATRRAGGARVALSWLAAELRRRRREGLRRPATAFHAMTDVARTAGALRQALGLARGRRSDDGRAPDGSA